jgi:hypothetical protein
MYHKYLCIHVRALINIGTLLVAQLVEAMRYKPKGRGFGFRW